MPQSLASFVQQYGEPVARFGAVGSTLLAGVVAAMQLVIARRDLRRERSTGAPAIPAGIPEPPRLIRTASLEEIERYGQGRAGRWPESIGYQPGGAAAGRGHASYPSSYSMRAGSFDAPDGRVPWGRAAALAGAVALVLLATGNLREPGPVAAALVVLLVHIVTWRPVTALAVLVLLGVHLLSPMGADTLAALLAILLVALAVRHARRAGSPAAALAGVAVSLGLAAWIL